MTAKRRRTTESLWMDSIRRQRTAKELHRSVRSNLRTSESNTTPPYSKSQPCNGTPTTHARSNEQSSDDIEGDTYSHRHGDASIPGSATAQAYAVSLSHNDVDEQDVMERFDDADRPSSSAGDPVLSDLEEQGIENDESFEKEFGPNRRQDPEFQPFERDEGICIDYVTPTTVTSPGNVHHSCQLTTVNGTAELNQPSDMPHSPTRYRQTHDEAIHNCNMWDSPDMGIRSNGREAWSLLRIWRGIPNLAALVSVVGSVRYTVRQYEFARDNIRDASVDTTWPPYARTQRYFRQIVDNCMPRSEIVKFRKTNVSVRAMTDGHDASDREYDPPDLELPQHTQTPVAQNGETESVKIFLPSAWAQLDVATPAVFDQMFPSFPAAAHGPNAFSSSRMGTEPAFNRCFEHTFVKSGDLQVRAGPGSCIAVTVQDEAPTFRHNYHISATTETYALKGSIVTNWNVGSNSGENANNFIDDVVSLRSLAQNYRSLAAALRRPQPPQQCSEGDTSGVVPGDLCTLLRSEHGQSDVFAVLVHRYWRCDEGLPSVMLFWVQLHPPESEAEPERESGIEYLNCHVVDDVSLVQLSAECENINDPDQEPSNSDVGMIYGTLRDGQPFLVYRILLYCDDFQKSSALYPRGSAGGCYFMPMSLPPEARRNTSSVRIISLTPPGVSTIEVLQYIVDDLVNASVSGVDGYTPSGQKVRIFIEVIGYVGDYPASASVLDVVGHVGRSPCTVCSFRRTQGQANQGSRFGYTTEVHANNSAFMRYEEMHMALRRSNISDAAAIKLGMVANEKYSNATCPLLYLQQEMNSRMSRSALASGRVLRNNFDAFRHNMIAPDHLLTGLAKDVLNAMHRSLPSNTLRLKADVMICSALRDNGLLSQKHVFNHTKKKIHSMTLSELFCVLLVSVPTLRQLMEECPPEHLSRDCFKLVHSLQALIALTYWWPMRDVDGEKAMNFVRYNKSTYISDLRCMSKRYVQDVHNFCKISEIGRKEMDKPNLHRLIELYEHTLPAFGHVREVMELVFESAHQPLKRCIARSNNHDAHIFAVEHCVGNDWQGRIAASLRNISHPDHATRVLSRRGLRRILLGPQADLLDEERHQNVIAEIDAVLYTQFTPAMHRYFENDGMISNFSVVKKCLWRAREMVDTEELSISLDVTESDVCSIIETAKRWMNTLYTTVPDSDEESLDEASDGIKLFRKARRTREAENGRQIGTPSGHDTISSNCCIQVHTVPCKIKNAIVTSAPESTGTRPYFFAVLVMLQGTDETAFALCYKCSKKRGYKGILHSDGINFI